MSRQNNNNQVLHGDNAFLRRNRSSEHGSSAASNAGESNESEVKPVFIEFDNNDSNVGSYLGDPFVTQFGYARPSRSSRRRMLSHLQSHNSASFIAPPREIKPNATVIEPLEDKGCPIFKV